MAQSQSIRCLVVPVGPASWLIPGALIAEVVNYRDPEGDPGVGWFVGYLPWRGVRVPVVEGRALVTAEPPADGGERLLILKSVGDALPVPHYAVVADGIPRLLNVNEDVLAAGHEGPEADGLDLLLPVLAAGEAALLPRLDRLEEELASRLPAGG